MPLPGDVEDIVEDLTRIEARLRDLAYDRLRSAAEEGDSGAEAEEKQLSKARRAVEKALKDLGGAPESW